MSVWVCFPSKRPPEVAQKVIDAWRAMGYKAAVLLDDGDPGLLADMTVRVATYPGWGGSMNRLASEAFNFADPQCDWVVAASDDIYPDPNVRADEIAAECNTHFGSLYTNPHITTFGVMQPIGDLKAWPASRIDRICGSPWLGREFCRRMYQGNGSFWPEYRHMHDDEELFEVSKKLGVLWQREDLTHRHEHWGRKSLAQRSDIPEFLRQANSQENWKRTQTLFNQRKAAGFPGHEPIA